MVRARVRVRVRVRGKIAAKIRAKNSVIRVSVPIAITLRVTVSGTRCRGLRMAGVHASDSRPGSGQVCATHESFLNANTPP